MKKKKRKENITNKQKVYRENQMEILYLKIQELKQEAQWIFTTAE